MQEAFYKLNRLLSAKQKRHALAAFGPMVLAAAFEFLSATLFLPFVAILARPNVIVSSPYLRSLKAMTGVTSDTAFAMLIGVGTILVIWASMLIRTFNIYTINRFCFSVLHTLTFDMMQLYLARHYSFYLKRNTAELTKTTLIEAEKVVRDVLFPFMRVALHAVIAVFLTILLFLISPVVALVTSLALGGCIYGISLGFRGPALLAGRTLHRARGERFRHAGEIFGGIKELKLLGRERGQLERFGLASMQYSNATARSEALASIPIFFVQAVAISAGIAALLYMNWLYGELGAALPSIAAFAYGAYRLMPSLQALASEISVVRYSIPSLDAFYSDYEAASRASREHIDGVAEPVVLEAGIEVKALSFRYGGQEREILRDISLLVEPGQRIGIVGSSGSGKSTLVDLIVGLLKPTEGAILIDGTRLETIGIRRWQRSFGYVPQTIFLTDDTIRSNIAFGVPTSEIDQAAVEEVARYAHLHRFISDDLKAGYDTIVGERGIRLSGGQRQRIGIARALYRRPAILILDEATNALDNETEAAIMASIDRLRERLTLITVAHRLSTIELYDRIYVLDEGRIVGAGTYAFLSQHNSKFQDLLSRRADAETS